ncbi:MAG: hypothetical protein AAGH15_07005 [Myxococcota bacterium]
MKRLLRFLLVLLVLGVVGVGTAWALVRTETPAIPLEGDTDHDDALALRAVIGHIGDPRRLSPGTRETVTLSQAQVDVLVAEASRRFDRASGRVKLHEGEVELEASAESPFPGITPYLDVTARLTGTPAAPQILEAKVGALPIPAGLFQGRADAAWALLQSRRPFLATLAESVEEVVLREGEASVTYVWTEELERELVAFGREVVLGELATDRLLTYHEAVVTTMRERRGEVPFVEFLNVLFGLAEERVQAGEDATRELRAASLVGTFYVVERPLGPLVSLEVPDPQRRLVLLWDRDDLPKHFFVSVLLTMWGDRDFADALGLSKEITDSTDEGGSGFSFADLAADRAGTQLAERSMSSPEVARALVARLAQPLTDAQLLPDPTVLPEGMDEAAFQEAYGRIDSPEYTALIEAIDGRLAGSDVRQALPGG